MSLGIRLALAVTSLIIITALVYLAAAFTLWSFDLSSLSPEERGRILIFWVSICVICAIGSFGMRIE